MKQNSDFVTSWGERTSYGVYFVGQLFFYVIVTAFLQLYMTDIGIPAAVVGGVFIIAKIWDAVNDPIFGVIVDKVNLKKGKYIPWVQLSSILIPISTVIMFAVPSSLGLQLKIIWIFFAYLLWDTSYTLCDVPIYALATAMTDVMKERNSIIIYSKLFGLIGGLIALIAIPLAYPQIGWPATVIIIAILGMAAMLPVGYIAKERIKGTEKEITVKELLTYLVKNKYLLIFSGTIILGSLSSTGGAVMNYAAIHCFGGPQWISILALAGAVPLLASVFLVQKVISRFNKFFVYNVCAGISLAGSVIVYFTGYTSAAALPIFFTLYVAKGLLGGMAGPISTMIVADCAEYGTYKTGDRAQGMAFSIQTFTAKLTAALSGAVCMFVLGYAGFVAGEGAPQSPETIKTIWFLFTAAPAITGVIALVLMVRFYKLRDKDVEVMARYNKGILNREEADAAMSQRYS
jgi:sugar (glycoside-pentoside-hexuronide) transporter